MPFENNIITLEMIGHELASAVAFSEAEQIRKSREGGSWGGYLQWDEGVSVSRKSETCFSLDTVRGRAFDPNGTYRVVTWAGLLDGADDIPAFRDIGRKISSVLCGNARRPSASDTQTRLDEALPPGSRFSKNSSPSASPSAISGSDGIPFKILVVKHLARRRWSELLEHACFTDLDNDNDGLLFTRDVTAALVKHTESRSPTQEAEAMVRCFDVDGDGAVSIADVKDLMTHFDDPRETDLWQRVNAKKVVSVVSSSSADKSGRGSPRVKKNTNPKTNKKQKRGQEMKARAEDE